MTTFGDMGVTAEQACLSMEILAGGCPHRQSEPVTLSTGELVACICVKCYRQLPADWITSEQACLNPSLCTCMYRPMTGGTVHHIEPHYRDPECPVHSEADVPLG